MEKYLVEADSRFQLLGVIVALVGKTMQELS
jgi:hypothetical protein